MARYFYSFIVFLCSLNAFSQPLEGATGLLNIPSAEMQADGTFFAGGNYLPDALTPDPFTYNTGNYYVGITFLPFMEVNYRMTLLKDELTGKIVNQDRSFGLRFRLMKETKLLPSVVAGGNDLYSSSPGIGSRYFNTLYGVATKHLDAGENRFGLTAGCGTGGVRKNNLKGIFGGISFSPSILPSFRLMAEYDTRSFNAGAGALFFRHLYLFGMAHEMKRFAGGFSCLVYLK